MSLILSGTDGLSDVDGSAATPAIRGTDANTGIFFPAADTIAFAEGGAEVARFDSAGNFGLGVTPSAWSAFTAVEMGSRGNSVSSYSAGGVYVGSNNYFNGTNWIYKISGAGTAPAQYYAADGLHVWQNAAAGTAGNTITFSEKMRLDASGNLGIGQTSIPSYARLSVTGTPGAQTDAKQQIVINAPTTTVGEGGGIRINAASGAKESVGIVGVVNNASGNYGSMTFAVYNGGATVPEYMRLDNSGNLLVGTTSQILSNTKFNFSSSQGTALGGMGFVNTVAPTAKWQIGPDSAGNFVVFNGSAVGVYVSNGGTSWTAYSDERLKTTIIPFENASAKVATLRAGTGRYLKDAEGTSRSFLIAQDVQKVLPEAVDANNPDALGLSYTDVIPLLVAAIQEQQALITQLTARITALESA